MKIVFIGVGHWHTRLYLEPTLTMSEHAIVGVSDPDAQPAQAVAQRVECPFWTDYVRMIETVKPDFAFVLGRHADMAPVAEFLIARKIAFAVEKPGALTSAQLFRLAGLAEQAGVFASVALVMRNSPLLGVLDTVAAGEKVRYASFKFIAGLVDRYIEEDVTWMLDKSTAGGGCMLNLGVHFVDLFRVLNGGHQAQVRGSMMSNLQSGLGIEDHGQLLLAANGSTCGIETGYLFPAPKSVFDLHFNIRTEGHYLIVKDQTHLEVWTADRRCTIHEIPTTNMGCYPLYTRDVLRRAQAGLAPIASLHDMAIALSTIEEGYRMAPLPIATQSAKSAE